MSLSAEYLCHLSRKMTHKYSKLFRYTQIIDLKTITYLANKKADPTSERSAFPDLCIIFLEETIFLKNNLSSTFMLAYNIL